MSTNQRELQLTNNVGISTYFRGNPVIPRVSAFASEQKIIEEYEKKKAAGKLKTKPIEELWNEPGL